ncbi:aminotransferase class I/II-fold pyridoxal phosphate-dependent enzyme [Acidiphilium sp. AL]|uniref:Aminotransferase n=1 Tax=Acidiphilium iwatense TaxID=768198 RepID=A0ABS9DWQ3_9PROT|nr:MULTISPECIES: aminotransferase class I/II-fold pyridoxal phosphate-dependent enzyme [Acidiphilium]MCF3947160.1 aminotransferase class I/II-fold pyridoxal phosphate-dependent enzyme [Acidiphilium iwatense]MCU4160643.1 aminotransferase class I/II-fold pyridoxal phosphate-dependent enzyme [Acidiphilium sp. AL]
MDITLIPRSKIGDIGRIAFGDPTIENLAFGESDHPPPAAAIEALIRAVRSGDTRYVDSRGRATLRTDLAAYLSALHATPVPEDRIVVTASGMAAISVAFAAILRAGDRVVIHEPEWPNLAGAALARGATVTRIGLDATSDGGFRLDLAKLDAALAGARVFCLNSPNNPTGWMASRAEIAAILDLCRRHGTWLLSDEVYSRLTFDGAAAAPSLLDHATPNDRVIVANSVSKTWAMTGFRVGWLVVPEGMRDAIGELTEATHSTVAPYSQEAARAALACEDFVDRFRDFCAEGRAIVQAGLAGLNRVQFQPPRASFYAFARIDGITDSLGLARKLVTEHKVAVAPGIAFGVAGEGHIRLCFAQSPEKLARAMDRLRAGLASLT